MMSVERIALDSKVEAQGLVKALAGKAAAPILAEVQASLTVYSSTQAPSPNMYSTWIPAILD